jgi:SAM-dependent methyltransferase
MFYPLLFPEERFEQAQGQADQILALSKFSGNTILDLACGPGRHSISLAKRGFRVTGVDLSAYLLAKARERAASLGVEVEWLQADMRQFHRPGAFDLCLSMFTSFGYFEEEGDDLVVLRNIHESLAAGGMFLLDISGKEWLARHFQPTSSQELDDGTLMIERREIVEDWSAVANQWILLKDGQVEEYRFQHRIFSARELKGLFLRAGFSLVRVYGNLDGAPYDLEADRLILLGHK